MNYQLRLKAAVRHFWATRDSQSSKQGSTTGIRDTGARSAVTGGRQMDGFVELIRDILLQSGIPRESIYCDSNLELPGFYRPEKKWDLIVVVNDRLLAAVEFKSQVGPSFGNNFNNRTEEAIGSASDIWVAYREGAFKLSESPWLGYLMLLEETEKSMSPVATREPHFEVFEEFRGASYSRRYELLLTKLVRERLYNSSCLLLSDRTTGAKGSFREPNADLSFNRFAQSLQERAIGAMQSRS